MALPSDSEIKTHEVCLCPLCRTEGTFIYKGLSDHLFGVEGQFNLKQCNDNSCGLIWLDPCPDTAEIGKLYQSYYTHDNQVSRMIGSGSPSRRAFKKAMFSQAMGYKWVGQRSDLNFFLGSLLALNRYHRERLQRSVLWLSPEDFETNRSSDDLHLLDVGCGSGDFMVSMQEMNWQVHGIEPDDHAAEIGRRKRALDITTGILQNTDLPANYFDAITLGHVIEHLPDPLATVTKAFTLLKPGGKLAVVTPNNRSLIHSLRKENWRGLEVPRHLQIFSLPSLTNLVAEAGFTVEMSRTYSGTAASMWARSSALAHRHRFPEENPNDAYGRHFKWSSELMALWEFILTGWPLRRPLGEELIVTGRKP